MALGGRQSSALGTSRSAADAGEIPDSEQGTHISSTRMNCEHSFSALGGRQSPHLTDVEGHTEEELYTTITRGHIRNIPLQTATGLCVLNNVLACACLIINPRRACAARVTVLALCVCLSVCLSVTALEATAFVSACNQRHLRHYFRH